MHLIIKDKQAGGTLYKLLARGSKTYRKRYGSHDRRGAISNRVSIRERPEAANKRDRLGDWEGDTVHGEDAIDNNRAERAIKTFVIGRKNWLFSNIRSDAQASAMLYSLIETVKVNGL